MELGILRKGFPGDIIIGAKSPIVLVTIAAGQFSKATGIHCDSSFNEIMKLEMKPREYMKIREPKTPS